MRRKPEGWQDPTTTPIRLFSTYSVRQYDCKRFKENDVYMIVNAATIMLVRCRQTGQEAICTSASRFHSRVKTLAERRYHDIRTDQLTNIRGRINEALNHPDCSSLLSFSSSCSTAALAQSCRVFKFHVTI